MNKNEYIHKVYSIISIFQRIFNNRNIILLLKFLRSSCGTWQQHSCPQGSKFNVLLRLCIPTQYQNQCPVSNQIATNRCYASYQCPMKSQCVNNICCVTKPTISGGMCPTMITPTATCASTSECGIGSACLNNRCCPLPICANNQYSLRICDNRNTCPGGYVCINSGCCPQVRIFRAELSLRYSISNFKCSPVEARQALGPTSPTLLLD